MDGAEQLLITFTRALISTTQIDVEASANGIIEQTSQYVSNEYDGSNGIMQWAL